jgi:8-oxo-dGTP pyrophosphatase MutT (NUDIX family)
MAGVRGAHAPHLGLRTHQGEVSFPGGRIEPGEAPMDGALPRGPEEIASIPPPSRSSASSTTWPRSPADRFAPFVGVLAGRPTTEPNPHEVEAVLHVPLAELADPDVFREEVWTFPGGRVQPITFFELVGDTVWGATAALLRQLLGIATGTLGRGDLDHS